MAEPWHSRTVDDVLSALDSRREGLRGDEAQARLDEHGPNLLAEQAQRSVWQIFIDQFKSVVILVLLAAGVLAVVGQKWPESIAIAAVLIVNTAIGFFSEWRAVRSMEALRQLGKTRTRVRRDAEVREIPSAEVVPGDIVTLEAEALVPADLRVIEARSVRVNEAALTGESVPVSKGAEPADAEAPLAERHSMLYKGSTLVAGEVEAVAVETGMSTEVGHISRMTQEAESTSTPLQQRLDRLGRRLAVLVIVIAVIVAGVGLLAGQETTLMIETALALGVAAIPEGLPVVATIALAHGMWLMARRNALINRLPAVETLGATTVIFTDKTGTLTENRMRLRKIVTPDEARTIGEEESDGEEAAGKGRTQPDETAAQAEGQQAELVQVALRIGLLCNDARLADEQQEGNSESDRGDPMEVALLKAGRAEGLARDALQEEWPRVRNVPFDRATNMMATLHEGRDGIYVAVKGAPTAVLEAADQIATEGQSGAAKLDQEQREHWNRRTKALAAKGLRLLAVADKRVGDREAEPYEGLRFVGLLGLLDPPRHEVRDAINECQRAGMRVVMVTGDQAETAKAIAEAVGIFGDPDDEEARVIHGADLKPLEALADKDRRHIHRSNIFARVSPEQKLNLVTVYQEFGDTVGMTGDGVNDAPALKKANIGIAMGLRGTDAAKQVADMVLKDDAFESIVAAVRQGRVIFGNIRKSVMFMLCTNGAEVLAVAAASMVGAPLPLRPLQILYLNVVTDVFPALALSVSKGLPHVMDRPPRDPNEPVMAKRHWLATGGWSVVIAACVVAGLAAGLQWLGLNEGAAVTISFLTLAFSKLWFVFNLRDRASNALVNEITRNPWIWGAIALCVALLLAAVYLPGLSNFLQTTSPGLRGWLVLLGLSLAPLVIGQVRLVIRRKGKVPV